MKRLISYCIICAYTSGFGGHSIYSRYEPPLWELPWDIVLAKIVLAGIAIACLEYLWRKNG